MAAGIIKYLHLVQDQNSYVDVAGFSNAKATVDSLFDGSISEKINLSDQSQWVKIK
ncbi:MAG: hypothetical protein ACLRQF_03120 [Thomasclavelia ramosa]